MKFSYYDYDKKKKHGSSGYALWNSRVQFEGHASGIKIILAERLKPCVECVIQPSQLSDSTKILKQSKQHVFLGQNCLLYQLNTGAKMVCWCPGAAVTVLIKDD